jgi:hypothetical protein
MHGRLNVKYITVTYIEKNLCWEANSSLASQEISLILWN